MDRSSDKLQCAIGFSTYLVDVVCPTEIRTDYDA